MKKLSLKQRKENALRIVPILRSCYPDAECTLNFDNAWQLLFAAILAAQCTDERVNRVTEIMFRELPNLEDYAVATGTELEDYVKSCGLYRNKAANIHASAVMLLERYGGKMPDTMEELLELPGVGRKIANLMLGDYFAIPGIVVDTHCKRITNLLGLSDEKDPPKIEADLAKILPREDWVAYGHLVVTHGRECCIARCRHCGRCDLRELCRYGQSLDEETLRQEGGLDACY